MYATKANGDMRAHQPCYRRQVQAKGRGFSMHVAPAQPPSCSNVYAFNVNTFSREEMQESCEKMQENTKRRMEQRLEEEYTRNAMINEEESRVLSEQHDRDIAEEKKRAEIQESIAKALEEKRLLAPFELCERMAPSSTVQYYWLDRNNNFYKYQKGKNPYIDVSIKKKIVRNKKKPVMTPVWWNSPYGDTADLCEGEWEYQMV